MSMRSSNGGGWLTIRSMDSNIGDDCLDGLVGAKGGVVSGGGVIFEVMSSSIIEKPGGAKGVVGRESNGVDGRATW
nr:hypothetical protein [Tanacetum cinerariifolium]